MTSMFHIP